MGVELFKMLKNKVSFLSLTLPQGIVQYLLNKWKFLEQHFVNPVTK